MSESRVHEHLDRMRRDELPEDARAVAEVLDDWRLRVHGLTSSSHDVGLLLDLLADEGYAVAPVGQVEELRAEIAQLRAGEDCAPHEPGARLTPGQWLARLHSMPAEDRIEKLTVFLDAVRDEVRCAGQRHELVIDELRAEVARLRAGEDRTPREESAWPTPGQLIARILDAPTAEKRLEIADALLTNCATASKCLMADHGALLSELEAAQEEIRVLRGALRDAIEAEVEFFKERMAALAAQNAVLRAALTARPPRLTVSGWAYRRRTRGRTRSRR